MVCMGKASNAIEELGRETQCLLQCVINKAHHQGLFQLPTPSRDEAGYPIIQYANDTRMIMRASQRELLSLKALLETYVQSIGLRVSFSKSCLVPLNMPQEKVEILAGIYRCHLQGMPFTYLGLPMDTTKPRVEHYALLMNRIERQLTSTFSMLTQVGKLQLVNSIISSLPTYTMCSIQALVAVLEYFYRARRYGMWNKTESNTRSRPLVAWKKCTRPKMKGRLGIINLRMQNKALLLKHFDKFYNKRDIPWVNLIWNTYYANRGIPHATKDKGSFWWRDIIQLCDEYIAIAK
jgi:hypothetical protein